MASFLSNFDLGLFNVFVIRFDLYFRKNPFGGEYTVFAGLEECIRLIANFKFTEDEISFIREILPGSCEVNEAYWFIRLLFSYIWC